MRIFHIVATDSGWGGLERSVVELAALQSAHHEVCVAAAPVVLARLPASVPRVALPMKLSRYDPRLVWRLARELRRFRPEVIHAHANKAAALVNLARRLAPGCARVATVQNTKRSVRVFAPYHEIIAVSRRAGAGLGALPHRVIWNAIPRIRRPETLPPDPSLPFVGGPRPVLAAVGRLVAAKGFDVLLEALREVDAALWLIGDGRLRGELETKARDLGVADRVWFAGFRRDAENLMCRADLMVISSRHEGFPFALVEMLHLERPVLSTRVAGAEEVLPPEWLCPADDAPALAMLIRRALGRGPALAGEFAPVFALARTRLALDETSRLIEETYLDALRRVAAT